MNTLINSITHYDRAAYSWCMQRRHARRIARAARQVSRLGDGPLYVAIGVLLAIFGGSEGLAFFFCALLAYAIEVPAYLLMKNLIKRDRPFIVTGISAFIVPSDKFSFPSGHTAAAFVMASLIALFYPSLTIAAILIAGAIGISRVLLGVHYFTDILAGAFLGTAATTIAWFILH